MEIPEHWETFLPSIFSLADETHYIVLPPHNTGYKCRTIDELHKTIDSLEKWSKDKTIALNRKKSVILVINDDGKDFDEILVSRLSQNTII